MTLDATVGGQWADSYLSVAAADALASADLGRAAAAWAASAVTATKEAALKRASTEIDAYLRSSGAARYSSIQKRLYPRAVDSASNVGLVSSSVAAASVITTGGPHGFTTGQTVTIAGHSGSTPSLDGSHVITVTGPTTFTIPVTVSVAGSGGTVANASVPTIPYLPEAIQRATFAQAKFLFANADVLDGAATRRARQMTSASEPNVSYSQDESVEVPFLTNEARSYLQGVFGHGSRISSVLISTDYSGSLTTDLLP